MKKMFLFLAALAVMAFAAAPALAAPTKCYKPNQGTNAGSTYAANTTPPYCNAGDVAYNSGGTQPASPTVGNWNGKYTKTPSDTHCDNPGSGTGYAPHQTGTEPGASEYHLDTSGDQYSCGGTKVATTTGWLSVNGSPAPGTPADVARTNGGDAQWSGCTVAGGVYGETQGVSVGHQGGVGGGCLSP
jgi:hypothetical protein